MELNYMGRIKSLIEFYNDINGSEASKIVIARGRSPWVGARPPFDPSVTNLNQVQLPRVADDVAATLATLSVSVTARYFLVSETAVTGLTPTATVQYNNVDLNAYPVSLSNALKLNGKLLLYMEFVFTNPNANAIHFRQIGFKHSSYHRDSAGTAPDTDTSTDVYMYENLAVQTININQQNTLTLKLVVAF